MRPIARDITLPDCRLLREKLVGDPRGAYHEAPGAVHVYPLLPVPEGRAARHALFQDLKARTVSASR